MVTTFLQALGISRDEIISKFYSFDHLHCQNGEFYRKVDDHLIGQRLEKGMLPENIEQEFIGKKSYQRYY